MTDPVAYAYLRLICPAHHFVGVLIVDETTSRRRVGGDAMGPLVDYAREGGNRFEWAVEDTDEFIDTCDACGGKKVGAPVGQLYAAVGELWRDPRKATDKFPMEYVDDPDD